MEYEDFYCLYNPNNSRSVYVPYQYSKYESNILEENKFFDFRKEGKAPFPFRICLNPSYGCNLACSYCFIKKREQYIPSIEDEKKFIDTWVERNPDASSFYIDCSGIGEPLLSFDHILKINEYGRSISDKIRKNVITSFVTNGTLLTVEKARILQKNQILFGISLDGYKEYHDRWRKTLGMQDTYDAIVSNLMKISDREFIGGAMTISSPDVDLLKAYLNMCDLFQTVSIRLGRVDYRNFDFSRLIKGYEEFTKILICEADNNSISNAKKIINGNDNFGNAIKRILLDSFVTRPCDAFLGRISMGRDGKAYGCPPANGMTGLELSKFENKQSLPRNIPCNDCRISHFCGGQCPINLIKGYHSDGYCRFKYALFKLAEEYCGHLLIRHSVLYQQLFDLAVETIERERPNSKLLKLIDKGCGYSYTQLKCLMDDKPQEFKKIYESYSLA